VISLKSLALTAQQSPLSILPATQVRHDATQTRQASICNQNQ